MSDSRLDYIDHSSFQAFRSLGHQFFIQLVWIYDRPVDLDGLRRFHQNLGHSILGRRVEKSPLPFGRHRWVACPAPAELDIAATAIPREAVLQWANERIASPIDPEHGPPWHLGVQPLTNGGAAVSLVTSHTVSDGLGLCISAAEAVRGERRDLNYPQPGERSRKDALRQDLADFARSLPDFARAVPAGIRSAKVTAKDRPRAARKKLPPATAADKRQITAPAIAVWIDLEQWDQRAKSLDGTSNALLTGLAARLAVLMGRTDTQDHVFLTWPVSIRKPGDTRGNALAGAMLSADPADVTTTLAPLRAGIRAANKTATEISDDLLASVALGQVTPGLLVRRLHAVLGDMPTVGCTNMGDIDPDVNRPDGTDADRLMVRGLEPTITKAVLDRTNGYLGLASLRANGRISITIGSWVPGGQNTSQQLAEWAQQAVHDMGMTCEVE